MRKSKTKLIKLGTAHLWEATSSGPHPHHKVLPWRTATILWQGAAMATHRALVAFQNPPART